jgi:hypothetical protein
MSAYKLKRHPHFFQGEAMMITRNDDFSFLERFGQKKRSDQFNDRSAF